MPIRSSSKEGPGAGDEQANLWQLRWRWYPGREVASDDTLVKDCVGLFSGHYGTWGPGGRSPGERVQITPDHFVRLVDDDAAWLACAYADGELVGYCVAIRLQIAERGQVAWVSQLVVHSTYRNARVATTLLYSIWQFSDCYAWGLATSNPFAIRALETATRRPCRSQLIVARGEELLSHISPHVPYLPERLLRHEEGRLQPRVDTQFFLDHSDLADMRKKAARPSRPWALGDLGEGEEWFGCTFHDQEPDALDDRHLADLLTGADGIWIQAYEGMTLDERHAWHRNAGREVEAVIAVSGIRRGARVLDVGCGDGRHVALLAERGYRAHGVDISERLINRARARITHEGATFEVADAREHLPEEDFDLAILLYDVIGSSARADDDLVMLRKVASRLHAGGHLVAGVMNARVTLDRLPEEHKPQSHADFIAALEKLPPSRTMETTGSVFDPALVVVYQGVHYRKEQFQLASWRLPSELVVRDRRFTSSSIAELVSRAGFEVIQVRPVQSGAWDREPPLDEADERAKELLVVARRT